MKLNSNQIGPRLKVYSKHMKVSQAELSAKVGISRIALNRFFMGRSEVRATDLVNIMRELGLDPLAGVPQVTDAQAI